ncbi:TfdA family taurine catabolism dioxygenase TauD [Nocardia caishijiensis]|uniref:TfdA family taurine catabolism dioxygenase TauD n=1 Tax=Nocardia caishijiensis TaxID=184756 RepID=A0ABQ6YI97_9NOCA|nr:TfdA family taurine catabolism dioxygenase TauD [Nocardia caishijiensis]
MQVKLDSNGPIISPSAWTPAQFSDSRAWSFTLTSAQQRALVDCGRGANHSVLRRDLGAPAEKWSHILNSGPGFVRLRGFPTGVLTAPEIERAYLALGTLLGVPVGQDREGNLITHIRDERRAGPGIRRYQTSLSQDFHSDASDLVGLLCLRPAAKGGRSKIVSAHALYNEMLSRAPHLVEVMYRPMPWSRHAEPRPGEISHFELAPFTTIDGMPRISFIAWFIRQSQHHPGAPRLTADQLAALDLAEEIANDPSRQITMEFRVGDVQLLNNTTVLHAREAYTDHDDPALRRHLLRLWLTVEASRADDVLRGGSPDVSVDP